MSELQPLGRGLMLAGALLLVLGAVLAFGPRIPGLGKLPGDVVFRLLLPARDVDTAERASDAVVVAVQALSL